MKKSIGKRLIAVLLTVTMMFSIVTMSVTTYSAGSFGNFMVNRAYTSGLLFVGKTINTVAKAIDVDEVEKIANSINIWVCGGNNNAQALAEINVLCTEILGEVREIDTKLDSYSSTITNMMAGSNLSWLVENMNNTYESDVEDVFSNKGISDVFKTFFNKDEVSKINIEEGTSTIEKRYSSYLVSCYMYKNEISDINGELFTFEEIESKREELIFAFCKAQNIKLNDYLGEDGSLSEDKEKALLDALFSVGGVGEAITGCITDLSDNLVKDSQDSYADRCAQVAYAGMPSVADQYEFIMSNISKQFMAICLTEMLYQEYMDIRGDYLETYHKNYDDNGELTAEDAALWNSYELDLHGNSDGKIKGFEDYNILAANEMENRLETKVKIATGKSVSLDAYVKPEDVEGIVLNNSEFVNNEEFDDAQPLISSEYMPADMLTAINKQCGIDVYYMLSGDNNGNHNAHALSSLSYKIEGAMGIDNYVQTDDARNLMKGKYSDSNNTYKCIKSAEDVESLFQTQSFPLYSSAPYSYLSEYYSDDDIVYETKYMLLDYSEHQSTGFLEDGRYVYKGINMGASYVGFDASTVNTVFIDGKSVIEQGYTERDGEEGFATNANLYGKGFSVILCNQGDEFKKSLTYSVNGSGDMYVTDDDGNIISSSSSVQSGQELRLHIKQEENEMIPVSLTLNRHNNTEHPDEITNSQVIIPSYDYFDTLEKDEDDYYVLDFTMPYSNTSLVLETEKRLDNDTNGKFVIKSYNELEKMRDMVNSGKEEYVTGSYVLANDITVPVGEMWTTPIGSKDNPFMGSFDGQGYEISGLKFNGSTEHFNFGLFGVVENAVINDVHLSNLKFNIYQGDNSVIGGETAGLCSFAYGNTEIKSCTVNGLINIKTGDVYAPASVAGICGGAIDDVLITNCANMCDINVNNAGGVKFIGCSGIAGDARGDATIMSCYNTGMITGGEKNHSIVAYCTEPPTNCYYLDTCASDLYATAKTKEQFNSGEVCNLLNEGKTDGTQAWYQNIDNGLTPDEYPMLINNGENTVYKNDCVKTYSNHKYQSLEKDKNGNFVIKSYYDLLVMASKVNADEEEYVNGSYVLANDITVPENEYWNTPIGTPDVKFSGTFDGQGYKIIGLKSNMPANYNPDSVVNNTNMGLFGWISNAEIKNLNLENVNFSFDDTYGIAYVGAICARAENDNTISKCTVSGCMTFNKASYVGGLVGTALAGKNNITNCANHIDFTITSGIACGGIAGNCDNSTTITKYYTVGDINGSFRNCSVIKGAGGKTTNCYVLDNTDYKIYSGTTECTIEQFKSGEVCYLLNKNSGSPDWVWFQNIDNGNTPDDYPTLKFNGENAVFKSNNTYTNNANGDANCDGIISIFDVTAIQLHCAQINLLTGEAFDNADVNGDGIISITDATLIQYYLAKQSDEL